MTQPTAPLPKTSFANLRILEEEERKSKLAELGSKMNFYSAMGIGSIHRFLKLPLPGIDEVNLHWLRFKLGECSRDALAYVCVDLSLPLPAENATKSEWVEQLIQWVCSHANLCKPKAHYMISE